MDVWYYDLTSKKLYYDADHEQNVDDAVTVAQLTDNGGNALTASEFLYSDIVYV